MIENITLRGILTAAVDDLAGLITAHLKSILARNLWELDLAERVLRTPADSTELRSSGHTHWVTFKGRVSRYLIPSAAAFMSGELGPGRKRENVVKTALMDLESTRASLMSPSASPHRRITKNTASEDICWRIQVSLPPDFPAAPPDPRALELAELRRLPNEQYGIVTLYHLGGVLDAGSTRPLLPLP